MFQWNISISTNCSFFHPVSGCIEAVSEIAADPPQGMIFPGFDTAAVILRQVFFILRHSFGAVDLKFTAVKR